MSIQIGNVVLGNSGVGWIIALLVFIISVVLMIVAKPLTDLVVLALMAGCALSRLL